MILNEEIYGNIGTVYHRSKSTPENIQEWLEKNEWKSGAGAGNLYGPGLYTVFTKSSNSKGYGEYLYRIHIKGIKNFFIFLPEVYNKVWGTNKSYDEMIAEQNKRFKTNVKKYTDFVKSGSELHSKCAGIIFHGNHDGDVCIIFEPKNAIFRNYSVDDGKTWRDINMSKEYKSNAFGKGGEIVDYTNKNRLKNKPGDFIPIKNNSEIKNCLKNEYGDFIPIKNNYKIKRLKNLEEISKALRSKIKYFKEIPYFSCYFNNKNVGFLLLNKKEDSFVLSLISGQFNGLGDEEAEDEDEVVFDFLDLTRPREIIKYNFLKLKELKNKISKEEYIKINKIAKSIN